MISSPIRENKTYANAIGTGIVIKKALSVTVEILHIAAESIITNKGQWETPLDLCSTFIITETKVIAEHHTKFVAPPIVGTPYLAISHISLNTRVIIILCAFGYSVPCFYQQVEVASLKSEIRDNSIPTP